MIGHYLLTVPLDREDRPLTTPMGPGGLHIGNEYWPGNPTCLVGTVGSYFGGFINWAGAKATAHAQARGGEFPSWDGRAWMYEGHECHSVMLRYDQLCARFGAPRVNAAIRNRILANRARRTLTAPRTTETAVELRVAEGAGTDPIECPIL